MKTIDFSPLFRSTVGFDYLDSLFESATREGNGYPPYNIQSVDENNYRITMAVAGFKQDEIEVTSEQNTLTISGKHAHEDNTKYLYHGIASRNFERTFRLAEHVKVNHAKLEDGLLHIDLVKEIPEALKPRKISISSGVSPKVLEDSAQPSA